MRRGRRKCQSTTSILDSCSQLTRKTSVCKFPSLSFQTRSRDQSHQAKRTKKSTDVSDAGNKPQGSCRIKKTVSSVQHIDTPKRQTNSIRTRNVERFSDGAASSSRCSDQPSIQVTEKRRTPAPASDEFSSVSPPPDVDTPKVIQEGNTSPSSALLDLLQAQPCTPPCNQPPDILVADTPERDYGLKVTWRRRRDVMLLLMERGHLSDSDVLIHS